MDRTPNSIDLVYVFDLFKAVLQYSIIVFKLMFFQFKNNPINQSSIFCFVPKHIQNYPIPPNTWVKPKFKYISLCFWFCSIYFACILLVSFSQSFLFLNKTTRWINKSIFVLDVNKNQEWLIAPCKWIDPTVNQFSLCF